MHDKLLILAIVILSISIKVVLQFSNKHKKKRKLSQRIRLPFIFLCMHAETIVSAHRRILGLASVVCVLVKIRVSSISLYKLDTNKLTAPFESAHQFTLVCTVSDSKTVTPSNGARAAIATQNSSTVYSGKTENKRWFQASGTW